METCTSVFGGPYFHFPSSLSTTNPEWLPRMLDVYPRA
jgi:hypothetical protein